METRRTGDKPLVRALALRVAALRVAALRVAALRVAPLALGLGAGFALGLPPAHAVASVPTALFGFELQDTSLQGEMLGSGADEARLRLIDRQARDLLASKGYVAIDPARVAAAGQGKVLRSCNGCDVDIARGLGARISVIGWVQKVSDLILNLNLVMRDVATGQVVHGGSVDIRGDTDISWSRGLAYLIARDVPAATSPVPAAPASAPATAQ